MPRLSKYKKDYCKDLVEHMDKGLSYESFAGKSSVTRCTLYAWEKKHPEWSLAKKKGEMKCLLFWERLGIQLAAGKLKGSAASYIFHMKNRFGWRDKLELTGEDGGPIKTKEESMTDIQLERSIKEQLDRLGLSDKKKNSPSKD